MELGPFDIIPVSPIPEWKHRARQATVMSLHGAAYHGRLGSMVVSSEKWKEGVEN